MPYEEKRVRLDSYGVCPSRLLARVPSVEGKSCRLHLLAAERFAEMRAAALEDITVDVLASSGWRPQQFTDRAKYERFLAAKYGSVAEGRKWLAFKSPHTTGLAVDLGSGGLEPRRGTAEQQRATPLHAWLVERAHEFGWHPYKREPWHWECPLTLEEWRTGEWER